MGQRQHEFGIRMALGAQSRDVLGVVVRQGMLLTLAGLVTGTILALAAMRLISQQTLTSSGLTGENGTGLLVNLHANDPLILVGVGVFLGAVALLASYLLARQATKVDPSTSLRQQ